MIDFELIAEHEAERQRIESSWSDDERDYRRELLTVELMRQWVTDGDKLCERIDRRQKVKNGRRRKEVQNS